MDENKALKEIAKSLNKMNKTLQQINNTVQYQLPLQCEHETTDETGKKHYSYLTFTPNKNVEREQQKEGGES